MARNYIGFQQRLVDIKSQIDDLQTTENQLLSDLLSIRITRSDLSTEYARLVNEKAAIGWLPDEVLSEIFSHLEGGWDNGLPFLLQASQVTRRWRSIALTTPSLWTTIEIHPIGDSLRYKRELLRAYLTRSGTGLVDISFYMCENRKIAPIVDLIIPQINRWRRLVVESTDELAVQMLVRSLSNLSAPFLQHFQIDLDQDDEQSQYVWWGEGSTLSGGVPSLYSLSTSGINIQSWLPPLGGVKSIFMADHYSATMLNFTQFRQILMASNSLTHLEMEGMINCSEEDDVTLVQMPHLVFLCVLPPDYVNPGHYMRNIFTTISAPSLRTLCLRKVYGQQFRAFLETFRDASWHHVLQTLILESVTGLEYLDPSFAHSSPTITRLCLKFITEPEPILRLLASHSFDPLWPQLETLAVGPVDHSLLRSIIHNRISAGCPLVNLHYATESRAAFDKIPAQEIDWLRERLRVENVSFHDM